MELRFLCGADILEKFCEEEGPWSEEDVKGMLSFGIAGVQREGVDLLDLIKTEER